jgi:hypothetical protein
MYATITENATQTRIAVTSQHSQGDFADGTAHSTKAVIGMTDASAAIALEMILPAPVTLCARLGTKTTTTTKIKKTKRPITVEKEANC